MIASVSTQTVLYCRPLSLCRSQSTWLKRKTRLLLTSCSPFIGEPWGATVGTTTTPMPGPLRYGKFSGLYFSLITSTKVRPSMSPGGSMMPSQSTSSPSAGRWDQTETDLSAHCMFQAFKYPFFKMCRWCTMQLWQPWKKWLMHESRKVVQLHFF